MSKLAVFAVLAVFGMVLVSDVTAQKKFSKVVTDSSRWDQIDHGSPEQCSGTPEDCAVKMLDALNISVGEEPDFSVYRLGEIEGKNVTVVFVSHLVDEDDSVIGLLYRLELSRGDAGSSSFNLDGVGRMFQCMRGPIGWRKTLCP
ncbi:MAG: hypothetical protein AB7Q37_10450 [Pyrinomonadaceae bacterium]